MKPILFNTEMVRAILEGRKTVTRRVCKFPADSAVTPMDFGCAKKPPYEVNDVLYVRETWRELIRPLGAPKEFDYKAARDARAVGLFKWKPSIHMPKEAARLFLRVTDVTVERLQDMTLEDFLNEGIAIDEDETLRELNIFDEANSLAKSKFINLWNSTLDKKSYANCWSANPYVWVIEFERITKEQAEP